MGNNFSECMGTESPTARAMDGIFFASEDKSEHAAAFDDESIVVGRKPSRVEDWAPRSVDLSSQSESPQRQPQQVMVLQSKKVSPARAEKEDPATENQEDKNAESDNELEVDEASETNSAVQEDPTLSRTTPSFASLLKFSLQTTIPEKAFFLERSDSQALPQDLRAFLVLIHPDHGLLALHCTRKKKKPPHYQVPGGHVDKEDWPPFEISPTNDSFLSMSMAMYNAAKTGGARELWEETGIDLRSNLDRLVPLVVRTEQKKGKTQLPNEIQERLFFVAELNNADFRSEADPIKRVKRVEAHPKGTPIQKDFNKLWVQLSVEHSGCCFIARPSLALTELELHSGGKIAKALKKALQLVPLVEGELTEEEEEKLAQYREELLTVDDDLDLVPKDSEEEMEKAVHDLIEEFQGGPTLSEEEQREQAQEEDLAVNELLQEFSGSADGSHDENERPEPLDAGAHDAEDAKLVPHQQKKELVASYADIAHEKREKEEIIKQQSEKEAAKIQEDIATQRLKSIQKLEEERKQIQKEEQRKAAQELAASTLQSVSKEDETSSQIGKEKQFLLLMSKRSGNATQKANQDRVLTMLESKRLPYVVLDGSDLNMKDRRNELFAISGIRGNYPQLFLLEGTMTTFVGDFDTVEGVNETGGLASLLVDDNVDK